MQLNLPAVEEDEVVPETAEVTNLPVLYPEIEDDAGADDDIDIQQVPELIADSGFHEIVASEWPDPTADESAEPEQTDAGDTEDVDASRAGT